MSKCNRLDGENECPHDARWRPVLRLQAQLGTPAATAEVGLKICEVHKAILQPEDFITDASWEKLCDGFQAMGKARPQRKLTTLDWLPLA